MTLLTVMEKRIGADMPLRYFEMGIDFKATEGKPVWNARTGTTPLWCDAH
jgi:hypothetical protein